MNNGTGPDNKQASIRSQPELITIVASNHLRKRAMKTRKLTRGQRETIAANWEQIQAVINAAARKCCKIPGIVDSLINDAASEALRLIAENRIELLDIMTLQAARSVQSAWRKTATRHRIDGEFKAHTMATNNSNRANGDHLLCYSPPEASSRRHFRPEQFSAAIDSTGVLQFASYGADRAA